MQRLGPPLVVPPPELRTRRAGRAAAPGALAAATCSPCRWAPCSDVRVVVSAIGTMSARATAVVRAKVSGELTSVRFKKATRCVQARCWPRSMHAATRLRCRRPRARCSATRRCSRMRSSTSSSAQDLLARDSIASQQVDTQAALVRQLEGTVASDQAQVDAARLQRGYTQVTAPFAGRLGLRQADKGSVVGPSDANGIVTINQVRPIGAAFSVPEARTCPRCAAVWPLARNCPWSCGTATAAASWPRAGWWRWTTPSTAPPAPSRSRPLLPMKTAPYTTTSSSTCACRSTCFRVC